MTESVHCYSGAAWRLIHSLWVGVNGSYKSVRQAWGSKDGTWHKVFPCRPALTGVVASGDTNPSLNAGDVVSLTFDRATNKPLDLTTKTGVQMDALLALNNGHSWGTAEASWSLAWNEAGTGLVVTCVALATSTIAVGDTVNCTLTFGVKDATGDSDACVDVVAMTGNWGVLPNLPSQPNMVTTGDPMGDGSRGNVQNTPTASLWSIPGSSGLTVTDIGDGVGALSGIFGQGQGTVTEYNGAVMLNGSRIWTGTFTITKNYMGGNCHVVCQFNGG